MAAVLHDCARTEMQVGSYDNAKILLLRSLSMNSRLLGKDRSLEAIAAVHRDLGTSSRKTGNLDDAESYCITSLDLMQRIHGSNVGHPELACILASLGHLAKDRGDFAIAGNLYRQRLEMGQLYFGSYGSHPFIANSFEHLAELAEAQGDLNRADLFFRESLKQDLLFYSPSKPEVLKISRLLSLSQDKRAFFEELNMCRKWTGVKGDSNEKDGSPKVVAVAHVTAHSLIPGPVVRDSDDVRLCISGSPNFYTRSARIS